MTDISGSSRRAPVSTTNEEQVSSKMQKTYVTPPERRQRRMTLRDDLRVTYVGEELDKHGVQGQKRNLTCNMFSIGVKSNTQIHMYSVVIEPEVKWRGMKDSLIQDCKFDQYHYNLNCIFFPDKKEVILFCVFQIWKSLNISGSLNLRFVKIKNHPKA